MLNQRLGNLFPGLPHAPNGGLVTWAAGELPPRFWCSGESLSWPQVQSPPQDEALRSKPGQTSGPWAVGPWAVGPWGRGTETTLTASLPRPAVLLEAPCCPRRSTAAGPGASVHPGGTDAWPAALTFSSPDGPTEPGAPIPSRPCSSARLPRQSTPTGGLDAGHEILHGSAGRSPRSRCPQGQCLPRGRPRRLPGFRPVPRPRRHPPSTPVYLCVQMPPSVRTPN